MIKKKQESLPKISIGLPVFNAEKFIEKRIESILNQSFTDFELIISDNASTDNTSQICNEFSKKDDRIRYIRQPKNMGVILNFKFVLEQAKGKYFAWAGADDFWHEDFLRKNIEALESNEKLAGSITKVRYFDLQIDKSTEKVDLVYRKFLKRIKDTLKPGGIYPLKGSYEEKVRKCLKKSRMSIIYGVYHRDILQKSFIILQEFAGNDIPIMLNVLKYGDLNVVDDIQIEIFEGGSSKSGYASYANPLNDNLTRIIFPCQPLTAWCFKHLGTRVFLKNLDYFIQLNVWGGFSIIVDSIRILIHKLERD